MEAWWEVEFGSPMPGGAIEHQHDLFSVSYPFCLGARRQRELHRRRVHRGQDQPLCPAGRRMHEAIDVTPFVSMGAHRRRPMPPARPHTPHDRFQAAACLIMCPHFDCHPGTPPPERGDPAAELFLKACCCVGEAAWAWRRRGTCKLHPRRCK